jgi:hypothetical protein
MKMDESIDFIDEILKLYDYGVDVSSFSQLHPEPILFSGGNVDAGVPSARITELPDDGNITLATSSPMPPAEPATATNGESQLHNSPKRYHDSLEALPDGHNAPKRRKFLISSLQPITNPSEREARIRMGRNRWETIFMAGGVRYVAGNVDTGIPR